MRTSKSLKQLSSLLLVIILLVAPLAAQQQQQPQPTPQASDVRAQPTGQKVEETTFDTLLAAKSYKWYGEIRMIGQLARSGSVLELLEPARLLGNPPKEFTATLEFLSANAEALATSRVIFAATPARPVIPSTFVAVEMSSPQDALKLEPKLRAFFSSVQSASTPTTASPAPIETNKAEAKPQTAAPKQQAVQAPAPRPVIIKREGSLIVMSDTSFTLKSLRPDGSHPLSADPNFQKARSRFASEALFIYYDVNLVPHITPTGSAPLKQSSATAAKPPAKTDKPTATADDKTAKPTATPRPVPESSKGAPEELLPPTPSATVIDPVIVPNDKAGDEPGQLGPVGPPAKGAKSGPNISTALPMLSLLFGGAEASLPEAVGAAVAVEGDEVVIRATLVNTPGAPTTLIPFIPFLVPGPEIGPRASALSPADTALFISVSLDAPRIYDAFLKMLKDSRIPPAADSESESEGDNFEKQIALFELALGFKIKEDLLGALGNEVAVSIPIEWFNIGPNVGLQPSTGTDSATASKTGFAVFISLNDKERAQEMLPRVLELSGIKAPGMAGQTEKRGRFEITSYGPAALSFMDDFLVVSTDISALRAVADAAENNQTLATNPTFKNATGWQSGRMLSQVYLSEEFTNRQGKETFVKFDDKLQEFLTRFNPKPSPITHAAFQDGSGIFHELHLPKDTVALMMAGLTSNDSLSPMAENEMRAVHVLMSIRGAQTAYKDTKGKGSYATREQLISEELMSKSRLEIEGYRIEITATGDKFEATATPTEYGKTGRQSFFMDESGIIRGGDHSGQPATADDKSL
ncbi:MAG: hypothetical protein WCF57_18425 [Pyrinomonadaceae bacterium]